jgi:hypothetical protein
MELLALREGTRGRERERERESSSSSSDMSARGSLVGGNGNCCCIGFRESADY